VPAIEETFLLLKRKFDFAIWISVVFHIVKEEGQNYNYQIVRLDIYV